MFGLYQKSNIGKIGETQASFFPLKKKDKNPYVLVLQQLLNSLYSLGLEEDGAFGTGTENAVKTKVNATGTVTFKHFESLLQKAFPANLGQTSVNIKARAKIAIDNILIAHSRIVDSIALAGEDAKVKSVFTSELQNLQSLKDTVYAGYLQNTSVKDGHGTSKLENEVLWKATIYANTLFPNKITDVIIWDKLAVWAQDKSEYQTIAAPYAAQAMQLAFVSVGILAYTQKYYKPQNQLPKEDGNGTNVMPWGNTDISPSPSPTNEKDPPKGSNKRDIGETIDNLVYIGTIGAFVAIGAKIIGIISGTVASAGRQLKS